MHSYLQQASTMARCSTKPNAVMEFDSLIATALSCEYFDNYIQTRTNDVQTTSSDALYLASGMDNATVNPSPDRSSQPHGVQMNSRGKYNALSKEWQPILHRTEPLLPVAFSIRKTNLWKPYTRLSPSAAEHTTPCTPEITVNSFKNIHVATQQSTTENKTASSHGSVCQSVTVIDTHQVCTR